MLACDLFDHAFSPACGCDLCVATADELNELCDAHTADAIEHQDAHAPAFFDATLDADVFCPLPWEDAFEPALHCLALHCLAPERPLPHRGVA